LHAPHHLQARHIATLQLDVSCGGAALHCTALQLQLQLQLQLHFTALHCTALHRTALHCAALHCTAPNRTKPHCTALRCAALHHTELHYAIFYTRMLGINRKVYTLILCMLTPPHPALIYTCISCTIHEYTKHALHHLQAWHIDALHVDF